MQTAAARTPQLDQARAVVELSFTMRADGWHYPAAEGEPLTRVLLTSKGYRIERRRRPALDWMPVVSASLAEFDAEGFRRWQDHWPLTA